MNRAWLALAVASLFAQTCHADAYPRRRDVDVLHYTFSVSFDDALVAIAAEASVKFRAVEEGAAGLRLDLSSPSGAAGMTVSRATSGGKPVEFTHRADVLEVALGRPLAVGEQEVVTIRYGGVPRGGLRAGSDRQGGRTLFAENWPDKAHHWLPVIDHPYDKATSEFLIAAPASYEAVANGRLRGRTELPGGRRLSHWSQSVPIPCWQNVVAIGPFVAFDASPPAAVPLRTWVYAQDRASAPALGRALRGTIEFFTERVGPFPYESLGAVELGIGYAGLENATLIFFSDRSLAGPDLEPLVAHEVAHQWFGDSVTEADWDDAWLSEGFATYFALLYLEQAKGVAALREGLARSRRTLLAARAADPAATVVRRNPADLSHVIDPPVYHKGAWTLHMLRGVVGPDAFREGVRAYYRRHRDGNATTADFRRAMEEAAGSDLAWFFAQWLERPGIPSVVGTWSYDPAARQVQLDLAQAQGGEPYRLPLEVGLVAAGGPEVVLARVEMTGGRLRSLIPADREPTSVLLDPNGWALMDASIRKR